MVLLLRAGPRRPRKVFFNTTAEGDELASAARAQRNARLDQRLQALSPGDRAIRPVVTISLMLPRRGARIRWAREKE